MTNAERDKRLSLVNNIPNFARQDHRNHLGEDGKPKFLKNLSRKQRRASDRASRHLVKEYHRVMSGILKSPPGFPIDIVLKELTLEYNHRFASSGTENQPLSFNYMEPFCNFGLICGAAPVLTLTPAEEHMLSMSDFFDYVTNPNSDSQDLSNLLALDEAKTFNFTSNGNVLDLRFTDAEGREFVVSGFSMVRRGASLHWYLLGGELYSDDEWQLMCVDLTKVDIDHAPTHKQAFLREMIEKNGAEVGAPRALEGTKHARQTIVAGEIDLISQKHINRCVMRETEHSFQIVSDDPFAVLDVVDQKKREAIQKHMMEGIKSASVLWEISNALFQLPNYFAHKIELSKDIIVKSGQRQKLKTKGGRGLAGQYTTVSAIEIIDDNRTAIRSQFLPHFSTETQGYWRTLSTRDAVGRDQHGNEVKGKTWVRSKQEWRVQSSERPTIYIKDTLAFAEKKISQIMAAAEQFDEKNAVQQGNKLPELYVLRSSAHNERVFKVGWTRGAASARAKEISSSTGVPLALVVVRSWQHEDAEALETEVHAILSPYRLNEGREFFQTDLEIIVSTVEAAIARADRVRG